MVRRRCALYPSSLRTLEYPRLGSMIVENWQLVTNEPVDFEKEPVEVRDYRKITNHFRGIYRTFPNLMKEN